MKRAFVSAALCLAILPSLGWAEETNPERLKELSIEDLMQIEVTSVSKRTEKLSRAAAAITVLTREDLRRSGVTSLPQALRLANGLEVARSGAANWAISARGFNSPTADKLLVLIDGRSIYTPLFSGVFWDVQDTPLEDVERIEIIRGPGAALWGSNAVNGVINVITRSAADTQGGLVTLGGGDEERGFGSVRYGGELGESGHYRVYGKYYDLDSLTRANGEDARDGRQFGQGGFRADWRQAGSGAFTLQGDLYGGRGDDPIRDDTDVDGGNLLGRWSRELAGGSGLDVQVYWDRTHRRIPEFFEEHRDTWDLDLQHHVRLGRQDVVWGAGYRFTRDRVGNSAQVAFEPSRESTGLFNLFAQDEIPFLEDRLRLTVGSKLEYSDDFGAEVQPSVRLAWSPDDRQTFWGAVSRAVRTPTRLDEDSRFFTGPVVTVRGNPDFEPEELIAYELGWRTQPRADLSLDLASFYHVYDDLRSQEPTPGTVFPLVLANKLEGETYGLEARVQYETGPAHWQAGYAYLGKKLRLDPDSRDPTGGLSGNDPRHRFLLRSLIDLPGRVELDFWLRHVSSLPTPEVPAYTELNVHLGWQPAEDVELSLVGQNLLHDRHPELGPPVPARIEVERSLYGKATWRF